jgi:asparagine synthase (glutamine-hydrolysing)
MCGIAGFAGATPGGERERVERMLATLVHRGPDSGGARCGAGWAVGARRLAIIDLVTGDQPIANETGDVIAVLNGEIYNYLELRERLAANGHHLRTASDTEVLVHLWEDEGPAMVLRLRGMFAIALVDVARRILFLARDRLGKKPLYWARAEAGLLFASELKALRVGLRTPPGVDPQGLASFLAFGFVPEGQCIATGVAKVPPAHWLRLDLHSGEIEQRRYWRLKLEPDEGMRFRAAQEELLAALDEAVALRLRSDVPLGVFLSGGLDSGAVAALARRRTEKVQAFTVSFGDGDELDLAKRTATRCGIELVPLRVEAEDGLGLLPRLAEAFDEPLADSSAIPTYLIAQAARRHVKVALNGDGGDEALAGYRRFLAARMLGLPAARLWAPALVRTLGVLGAWGGARSGWGHRLLAGMESGADPYPAWGPVKFTGDEVAAMLGSGLDLAAALPRGERGTGSIVDRMRTLDLEFFLPGDLLAKMDRATMACSLEARSPLLDHVLLERVAAFPSRLLLRGWRTKAVLRAATAGILPRTVRHAPKRGFEVPLLAWLDGPWRDEVRTVLEDPSAVLRRIVPLASVAAWRNWHRHPDRRRAARAMFTLITLEHWLRRWA